MRRESFVIRNNLELRLSIFRNIFTFKYTVLEIKECVQWSSTWEFTTISHCSPCIYRLHHVSHRLRCDVVEVCIDELVDRMVI